MSGAADYVKALRAHKVILDPAERAALIAEQARALAKEHKLALVEDEALLSENAGLTEWPLVLMGSFEEAFLEVPAECLMLSMKQHQKCFSLKHPRSGKLAAKFLLVSNLTPKDGGAQIIAGNEKVIRARLADAKFFWEQDLKKPLDEMANALAGITFHEKLGSQKERVERVAELAFQIAGSVDAVPEDARRAAQLAKADLVSGMVGEFPELQGLMGRYYAEAGGIKPEIARAIELHYKPKGPTDTVPLASQGDAVAIAVALADKLDTLVGFWAIGEKPTGSGDPYQLRRAALGVIRIVLENDLRLSLTEVMLLSSLFLPSRNFRRSESKCRRETCLRMQVSARNLCEQVRKKHFALRPVIEFAQEAVAQAMQISKDLLAFFADRLKVHLRDKGARHDLIDAVFALGGQDDLALIVKRVEALGRVPQDRRRRHPAGRRQARRQHPARRGEEGQEELGRRRRSGPAARAAGDHALRDDPEGEGGHDSRHQRGELRRRHAGAGRAARARRCLLRQGHGQRHRRARGRAPARQPPRPPLRDPRRHPQRRRLLQDRRLMPAFPGGKRSGAKNSEAGDAIAIPGLENQSKSLLEG